MRSSVLAFGFVTLSLMAGCKDKASKAKTTVVSNGAELAKNTNVTVSRILGQTSPVMSDVTLTFENTTYDTLRVTKPDVIALDSAGGVIKPMLIAADFSVDPKAKQKITIPFPVKADSIVYVHCWDKDVYISPDARTHN
jgi:hypothetical protein